MPPEMKNRHLKNEVRRGFTLVELLVVIAIISILAGLLLPAMENAIDTARQLKCSNNQRQVGLSVSMYVEDFDGWITNWRGWVNDLVVNDYLVSWPDKYGEPHLAICPTWPNYFTSTRNGMGFQYEHCVYGTTDHISHYTNLYKGDCTRLYGIDIFVPRLAKRRRLAKSPSQWIKFGDSLWDPNGRNSQWGNLLVAGLHLRHNDRANVWFVDGHVQALDGATLLEPDLYDWRTMVGSNSGYYHVYTEGGVDLR